MHAQARAARPAAAWRARLWRLLLLHHALRNKRLGPGSRLRSIAFPAGRALLGRTLRLLAKMTALQDQQPQVTRCMRGQHL